MSDINYGHTNNAVVDLEIHMQPAQDSDGEPLFTGLEKSLPPMPECLQGVAKEAWEYLGRKLDAAGMICKIDLNAFKRYCETVELYEYAQAKVVENGEFQKTPNGYYQLSPWSIARERHANMLAKLEAKLFLTPFSRKALKVDNPAQMELDLG